MKFINAMIERLPHVRKLRAELNGAVEYHEHYTRCIDIALSQPRIGTDLLNCQVNAIGRMNRKNEDLQAWAAELEDHLKHTSESLKRINECLVWHRKALAEARKAEARKVENVTIQETANASVRRGTPSPPVDCSGCAKQAAKGETP